MDNNIKEIIINFIISKDRMEVSNIFLKEYTSLVYTKLVWYK